MDENLRNAIREVFEKETDDFLAGLDEAPHEFGRSYEKSARRLIRRRRKSYYPLISSVGRRIITTAAVASVMCGSVMTAASVRDTTSEIKQNNEDYHFSLTVDNDTAKHYSETIEKEYELTAVPDGFEMGIYQPSEKKVRTVYKKGSDYIIFYQYTKSAFYSSFLFDKQEVFTDENDTQYICYYIDDDFSRRYHSIFYWDNGEYIFEASSNIDRQELFEVCKSLEIKE